MATLPPWLDYSPQVFAGAAEHGLSTGVQEGALRERATEFGQEMQLKRDEMAQRMALSQQEMGIRNTEMKMKLAGFLSDLKQRNLDNQLKVEKMQTDKNLAEQQLAVDKQFKQETMQWRMSTEQNQQNRVQMQADVAARKFQAQQAALTRIHNGEDPARVFLDLGGALGESAAGMASLYKQLQPQRDVQYPTSPQVVEKDGQKFLLNYDDKGVPRWTQMRPDAGGGDKMKVTALQNAIKTLSTMADATTAGSPTQKKIAQYTAMLDQLLGISQPGMGASGIRGISNVRPAPSPEHDETGDQGAALESPSHDEPGQTEAEATPNQLMDFSRAPAYGSGLGLP